MNLICSMELHCVMWRTRVEGRRESWKSWVSHERFVTCFKVCHDTGIKISNGSVEIETQGSTRISKKLLSAITNFHGELKWSSNKVESYFSRLNSHPSIREFLPVYHPQIQTGSAYLFAEIFNPHGSCIFLALPPPPKTSSPPNLIARHSGNGS